MDSKLLNKYFRGECTAEEVQQVLNWFKSKELTSSQEQDLYKFWQEADKEKEEYTQDSARILAAINKQIDGEESKSFRLNSLKENIHTRNIPVDQWRWIGKAAAAVLLLVCVGWLLTSNLFDDGRGHSNIITVETVPGSRKKVVLADGSAVTLNGGSSISYGEHFTPQTREIILRGEAFFEVAKDSLRPFIVRTGNLSTQALGTSFNIKYHQKEHNISVALATGIVKVGLKATKGTSHLARLMPGEQLVYNKTYQSYKVAHYDSLDVLGWREGVLYFKKANLQQVVSKLENHYGVDIELTGKVPSKEKEWLYTGTYHNESLYNVLEGIAFVKSFTYQKINNQVIIKFN